MLQPVSDSRKRQTARTYSIPAAVGGLNAKDSIASMPERDALILTNIFPEETECNVRRGFTESATGMTDAVDSLIVYNGPAASEMFAANGANIFDVSSAGAVGAAVKGSLTSDRFQYLNFTTSGGSFLLMMNGADTPVQYDGTTWSDSTITGSGLTTSDLIYPWAHKERIWMIEKDSMDAWYLGTQAITGTATKFPLGSVFDKGGYLVAGGRVSSDSGAGIDDLMVFLTSEGEVALYQGTNPSSASTWALVGVYQVGKPIGQRPIINFGGDLLILTRDGVVSAKKIFQLDVAQSQYASVTDKINRLINAAAKDYSANFGWEMKIYPTGKWLVLNIPLTEGSLQIQYVMNIITGAWCKFEGMNANTWALYNGDLYFSGNDGKTYKADTGFNDNGDQIQAEYKGAFNYFGGKGSQKHFTMMRPVLGSTGAPSYLVGVDVDFKNETPAGSLAVEELSGATWDTSTWDTGIWGGGENIIIGWTTVTGIGINAAVHLKIVVQGMSCSIYAFDIIAQRGGPL